VGGFGVHYDDLAVGSGGPRFGATSEFLVLSMNHILALEQVRYLGLIEDVLGLRWLVRLTSVLRAGKRGVM
jgi:hypothetical protein